jgi:predicted O-methyltransferase YrrM
MSERAMVTAVLPPPERHLLPEDVDRIVADVDGWFGPDEGRLLYDLASEADPAGCIVEIGSWHGRSTIWLAAGAKAGRGATVVAIDPHAGTNLRAGGERTDGILRSNLARAGLADVVEVVVATSQDSAVGWSRPVSLLWVDGDHTYQGVRRDLELWLPFLTPDATVALHDTFVIAGPERVAHEVLIDTGRFTSFVHAETTTAARRCGRLRGRARLERRLGLVRRALYGMRLRAYDTNRFGLATLRDLVVRR